jgi:hypothetical protein
MNIGPVPKGFILLRNTFLFLSKRFASFIFVYPEGTVIQAISFSLICFLEYKLRLKEKTNSRLTYENNILKHFKGDV